MSISKQLPAAVSNPAISAVGDAFMEGLRVGCYVVAAACLLASIAAFLFPARPRPTRSRGQAHGHPQARTPNRIVRRPQTDELPDPLGASRCADAAGLSASCGGER